MVLLFKKWTRNVKNFYRFRVFAGYEELYRGQSARRQAAMVAENMTLLDDNQCGFRSGRLTAYATSIFVKIQEDVQVPAERIDLYRRVVKTDISLDLTSRLLDLTNTYFRFNKPALLRVLETLWS